MKRGRKPVPPALKLMRGNPGRRRIPAVAPVPPLAGTASPASPLPPCPAWLAAEAKREWKRLVPELQRLALVDPVDWGVLAAYCQAWAHWQAAEQWLQKWGTTYTLRNDKGEVKQMGPAPQVGVAMKYLEKMRQFAGELGLTPAARAGLRPAGGAAAPQENPLLAFLNRQKQKGA